MNPLDKSELSFVIRNMEKEMPMLTSQTAKIPNPYGYFPKNLKEQADKVNEKYLNKHLAVIEEISYRYPNHLLPQWMKNYQNRYFKANIAHDGFFKNNINESGYTKNTRFMFDGNTFIQFGLENGATLATPASTSSGSNLDVYIYAQAVAAGLIGQYYNEICFHRATNFGAGSHGNLRYGVYDQQAGVPTNLMADTGLFSSDNIPDNDFTTFKSVTQFALTTTANYTAILGDSGGTVYPTWFTGTPSPINTSAYKSTSATTFSNPGSWDVTTYNSFFESKIAHT